MEQQEVPAGWWDAEADRSLLAGVFKHGRFSGYEPTCVKTGGGFVDIHHYGLPLSSNLSSLGESFWSYNSVDFFCVTRL